MIPFCELSMSGRGLIAAWMLIMFWGYVFLEAYAVYLRQKWYRALLPVMIIFIYVILQSMLSVIIEDNLQLMSIQIIRGLPMVICLIGGGLLMLLWGAIFYQSIHWRKTHITGMSLKQSVDMLPEGICCYDRDGKVRLKNHTMEELSRTLTGKSLLNGKIFYEQIQNGDMRSDCYLTQFADKQVVVLGDGNAYSLIHEPIENMKKKTFMLVAMDITEEYRNTQMLLSRQNQLKELNQRLKQYNREIVSITAAREALNAKIRIHDELGSCLLASKKYILDGGSEEERQSIEASLRRNIHYLMQGSEQSATDEYELVLNTAKHLGIKIDVSGYMPEEKAVKHILVTAIHECLTNTLRHAHGDRMNVKLIHNNHQYQMQITNNGQSPDQPVQETGGLESLRRMVEDADGSMKTDIQNGFLLTITLPEEVKTDEI